MCFLIALQNSSRIHSEVCLHVKTHFLKMGLSNNNTAKNRSQIIEFLGGPENFARYENSQNNEERINVIYHTPMIQALFKRQKEIFKTSEENFKNDRESKRLRELGNNAFKNKRDDKALELYNEAVVYANQVKVLNQKI